MLTTPSLAPPSPLPGRGRAWIAGLLLAALAGCANLPSNVVRPVSTALAEPAQTPLGQLAQTKRSQAGTKNESGFKLLDSAEMALSARLALVDAAQKTLDIQYYAIHADPTTDVLIERLRAATARGVRVRILLDDFNTSGRNAQILHLAFEKNLQLRLFNPLPGSRGSLVLRILGSLDDVGRIQRRMHNKIFVADNAWGITGGRNIGETYFGQGKNTNFVDTDVLAVGPVVRTLSTSFDAYWNSELAYPVQSLVSQKELDALKAPAAGGKPAEATVKPGILSTANAGELPAPPVSVPGFDLQQLPLTWASAAVLVDKPSKIAADASDTEDAQDTVIDGLLQLIALAKRDLLIVSPYFVPGQRMMDQFAGLRARGVRVRVLTNSLASNDAPLAHVGYARYRKALLEAGIELFEMRSEQSAGVGGLGGSSGGSGGASPSGAGSKASLHSKMVVMDGRLLVIGSMNLDLRSQLQNSEVALVVRNIPLAQAATKLIEPTLQTGAYRVQLVNGQLVWSFPGQPDRTSEPDSSTGLKILLQL
ncbi:MAG: phospholipase D family protein, partial [Pseudomonadota bacterium]